MARITEELDFTDCGLLAEELGAMSEPQSFARSRNQMHSSSQLGGQPQSSVRCLLLGLVAIVQLLGLTYLVLAH